jgi:hypothetical protein
VGFIKIINTIGEVGRPRSGQEGISTWSVGTGALGSVLGFAIVCPRMPWLEQNRDLGV